MAGDQLSWALENLNAFSTFEEGDYATFKVGENFSEKMKTVTQESGVYVVLGSYERQFKVLYIGSSGKLKQGDRITVRAGGVRSRLVEGKKNRKNRASQWEEDMNRANIQELRIYWLQTAFDQVSGYPTKIPLFVEATLIQSYFENYGVPPEWNLSF